MEKYHASSVIQDFVFLSRKKGCIRCISLQVYNKTIEESIHNFMLKNVRALEF